MTLTQLLDRQNVLFAERVQGFAYVSYCAASLGQCDVCAKWYVTGSRVIGIHPEDLIGHDVLVDYIITGDPAVVIAQFDPEACLLVCSRVCAECYRLTR